MFKASLKNAIPKTWQHGVALAALCLSVLFFINGILLPLFSTTTEFIGLVMGHTKVNLFSSIEFMWGRADYFLAILIALFTFVLPVIKYLDLFAKYLSLNLWPKAVSKILDALDKWSMLDVFIVAQIIVVFKFSTKFVEIDLESGTICLTVSIFLRMIAGQFIRKLVF